MKLLRSSTNLLVSAIVCLVLSYTFRIIGKNIITDIVFLSNLAIGVFFTYRLIYYFILDTNSVRDSVALRDHMQSLGYNQKAIINEVTNKLKNNSFISFSLKGEKYSFFVGKNTKRKFGRRYTIIENEAKALGIALVFDDLNDQYMLYSQPND